MSFRVVNPKQLVPEAEELLKQNGIEVIRPKGPSREELLLAVADADALIVFLSPEYTIDSEVISAGKRLKLIARFGAGVDNIDIRAAREAGITVTYTPEANSNSVAELALYHIIALAKNAQIVNRRIHAGEFNEIRKLSAVELEGKTLGLIGNGHIAGLLAKKAGYGLGMKVIGYNPHENSVFPKEIERVGTLEELLSSSDFVSIHAPANEETVGLFGRRQFEQMKRTAFLINTARGRIVQEQELIRALKEGLIAGAGLDVYEKEPLGESELKQFDQVILTPHYGGFTDGAVVNTGLQVAESIISVSRGETPKYIYEK